MWRHKGAGSWHFMSLPQKVSGEIRRHFKWQEEGWGRLKTVAQINEIRWETALWFDTNLNTYLLPIKAEIRNKSDLKLNQKYEINIWI